MWLLINSTAVQKRVKSFTCSFRTLEGTWRAMSSTLTAVLSPGLTQHNCVCAPTKTASPLTCVLHLPSALTSCDTTGAGQHRLIRSAPSRPVDVAVAQNDLPPSCATVLSPVAHPPSRSMISPAPSVTVMIRPAADETTTRDGRPLGQAVTSYVADAGWTGFVCEVKSLQWQRPGSACKSFRTRRA